ncbi:MAG: phosphoribosyltransferase family protein [Candidatus Fimivivens sp.]|nr:phosphoribosyltransferase family protein [Candidatus Fimivivens sp.]
MLVEKSFHDCELLNINGKNFVINELTEQIPATRPELLWQAARKVAALTNFDGINKIVSEEEKGAVLVAAVSLLMGIPFGLARWYPSGLSGQIEVGFTCEYAAGKIYLNGVEPGDRVIIVDDMISTGGTLIALIEAVRAAGAEIVDVVSLADKAEYNGIQRIKDATGIEAKSVVTVSVTGSKSKVHEYKGN